MKTHTHFKGFISIKAWIALVSVVLIVVLAWFLATPLTQKSDVPIASHDDTTKLIFAHHMSEQSTVHKAALRFADEANKSSDGKIQIQVVPNQQLGNSFEMLERSRMGEIDILITASAKISPTVPAMFYPDLPFLFPTQQDADALLDGKVGKMVFQELGKADLIGVAFWDGGYKEVTSNRLLNHLESFHGLRIRVMKSRVIMEQYLALGAQPITIDFHATKKALETGAVEAQENPLDEIVTMEFDKVQSHLLMGELSYLPYVLTFSKKSFEKLPINTQTMLLKIAGDVTQWERQEARRKHGVLLEKLRSEGIVIDTLEPEEKMRLKEATAYIPKMFEEQIGTHILSKSEEYFYEKEKHNSDIVAIGIDADLSGGAKGAGLAIKRGVELAVDTINEQGGLLEKHVVVVAKDHQGVSTQAKENINAFIKDKNIIAVIGGKHSAIITSYMPEIQNNHLLFFSPWAAAPSVTENGYSNNFCFRVSLNDRIASDFLAQEALKLGKKPLIVVENSVWGKEALENIKRYLTSQGVETKPGIIINRGEVDFSKVLTAMEQRHSNVMIMVLNAQEGSRLVSYLGKLKYAIPIISHWGIVGDNFYKNNRQFLKDIDLRFVQTVTFNDTLTPQQRTLQKRYHERYKTSQKSQINALTGVVQAYDAVMLLAHAIEKAKSFEPQLVKKALESLETYDGVLRTYEHPFSHSNHEALRKSDLFMATYDDKGRIIPLKE